VGLAAEVTAVGAVAVEIDQPTATLALTSQAREFGTAAAHAFTIGAAESRGLSSRDPKGTTGAVDESLFVRLCGLRRCGYSMRVAASSLIRSHP
jgi:hypothetical protein